MKSSTSIFKVFSLVFLFLGISPSIISQTRYFSISLTGVKECNESISPTRTIVEETSESITIEYDFSGFSIAEMETDGSLYHVLRMEGLGLSLKAGAPSLPYRADRFALPQAEKPSLTVLRANYTEIEGYTIIPAPEMPTDGVSDITHFIADKDIYSTDAYYPSSTVSLEGIQTMKEVPVATIQLTPVQYNPVTGLLRICTTLTLRIEFGNSAAPIAKSALPVSLDPMLRNIVVNPGNTAMKYMEKSGPYGVDPTGYLIVTTPDYAAAVDSFADWKRQLGYRVYILMQSSWEIEEVSSVVHDAYFSHYPRPAYLLIFGDQQDVPDYYYENIYLDPPLPVHSTNYYACMDGWDDYIPEMAHGRIPVNSSAQAQLVVDKIINYEKSPPDDPSFYRKGMHAGYFQDSAKDGRAEKRYAHTSIELYDYLTSQGYESDRVFYTEEDVTPVMFNPYYSGNTTIPPEYLRQNGFPWDGDKEDIINGINDGRFYVFHRDHGLQHGWVSPQIDNDDLDLLHNGDETPVVLSVNCSSGMFWKSEEDECFAEKLLRHPNGGAVGIVASTEENRSGYNDGFIFGMIDAIWSDPGIVPDLGTGKDPDPAITPHDPIYTMGDVMIQGLIRMTETWDTIGWADRDHFNLYHYFGDPAMQIWTDIPVQATAEHIGSLVPGTASITISGSNCTDGIATAYYNNDIQSKIRLSGGFGTLSFPEPLADTVNEIILTVYKHNYIPYQAIIPVGNQPIAKFRVSEHQICPFTAIYLFDESENGPESWTWEISPSTFQFMNGTNANSQNPEVMFSSSGSYDVSLTVSSAEGSNSITKPNFITVSQMPATPVAEGIEFCDQGSALLTASGASGIYQWWNSSDRQQLLSDSSTYQTPLLNSSNSYYVEALPDLVSKELGTVYANTNYANGNMFDIITINGIRIDSFSINVHDNLDHIAEVYYKQGTFEGAETKPDNWTLLGAYPVEGKGSNMPATVDIDDIYLSGGETYGFYITLTNGTLGYTHGGNSYTGEDFSIYCGAGVSYPFSTVYSPRTWNGTVHYSVGQYGCNSELVEVQVLITPTPEAPADQFHDICYDNDSVTLHVDRGSVIWYKDSLLTDSITAGNTYRPADMEVGLNSYYVIESENLCTSLPGKIAVNLHEPAELPVTQDVSICFGDTAALIATGDHIRWYESGLLLADSDTLFVPGEIDGIKNFNVTNTVDGCESKSLSVELQVQPKTPPPKSMNRFVCEKDTVLLIAEGTEINWYEYADMSLFEENKDTIILKAIDPGEHKFIITNRINGCVSDTILVSVFAKTLPESPTVVKSNFCEGEFVHLEANGENIRWFADKFLQEMLSDSNIYEPGYLKTDTHTYFLDQTIDGCISELYPQNIVVHALPDIDLGEDATIYLGEELVITCETENECIWQDNSTGDSYYFVADQFGTGIHEISVMVLNEANCTSSDTLLVEVMKPLGSNLQSEDNLVVIYPNPTSGLVTIEFSKTIELPVLISMYDTKAQCVMKRQTGSIEKGDKLDIDLTGKPQGIYMLIIEDQDNRYGFSIVYE